MKILRIQTILISLGIVFSLSGCSSEVSNVASAQNLSEEEIQELNDSVAVQSSYYYLPVGTYDSADTAILKSIDKDAGTVTLYNTVAAKTYTLNYDGTTYVSDKYGTGMSMAQLEEGTIVNVNFFKATKQLVDIQISPEAWTYDDIKKYDLGGINSTATIGDRTYALTKGVQVFSQGNQTDVMNIVSGDSITVSGIGYDIYSIKVESGHGYVRLNNDEALIGGWIEIGNELITQVTEPNMLLAVPEGSYTVHMYNDNSRTTQEILVDRNQEVVLDCGEITAPVDTFGRILFHVDPENASLSLDGEKQDISGIVKAEYGIHEIEISASGYDTLSRYINVGTELAEITIHLEESVAYVSGNSSGNSTYTDSSLTNDQNQNSSENNTSKNSVSGNTTSGNTSTTKTTSASNRVYIYSPTDVEVYLDGIYVGISPTSFKKTTGSHTIILKKSGYENRSYTIYCYDDGNDMSISFSELEKIENNSTSSSNNTTNNSSANTTKNTSGNNTNTSTGNTTSNTTGNTTSNTTGNDAKDKTDNTANDSSNTKDNSSDNTGDSNTTEGDGNNKKEDSEQSSESKDETSKDKETNGGDTDTQTKENESNDKSEGNSDGDGIDSKDNSSNETKKDI